MSKSIGKTELVADLAKKSDLSQAKAGEVLNALLDTIMASVAKGNSVTITGFGTFSVRKRAARSGRNPRTGETIKIKASKNPAFKAGAGFKAKVNK